MTIARTVLDDLWTQAGCDPAALAQVELTGDDPVLPSIFRVGAAASASIAASALAAAELWRLRSGRRQGVAVDMRAAATAFRSERYLLIDGRPGKELWDPIAGYYRTGDGGWVQLHTNHPHHRDGVLEMLHCASSRAAVADALSRLAGREIEERLIEAGLPGGLLRSPEEWRAHPQGQAVARLPLLEIVRIGDAPPEPLPAGARPLSGIRVLDLTHVIAGPVGTRTLAVHGAEVLRIGARHLPAMGSLIVDTGRGKRSAWLDLRRPDQADRLRALVRRADIFVQGYRPGALAARGFSPEAVAALRPGIVYVTLSAFGHEGPWRDRRGFDSVVQTLSGIAWEGGRAAGTGGPKPLPCQALDHATGYLIAFGAMAALARRAQEGGSWLVRLSLAQTGRWLDGLGRVDGLDAPDPALADVADLLQMTDGPYGRVTATAPVAKMSETPAYWASPTAPPGTHPPIWADEAGSA